MLKKWLHQLFGKKFFLRILLSNLLIILVTLGILTVTVSESVARDAREKEIKFNTQILEGVRSYFEVKQSIVKQIIQQVFLDPATYGYLFDLVELAEMPEIEYRNKRAKLDVFLYSAFARDVDITSVSIYPRKEGLFRPISINKWGGELKVLSEDIRRAERITDDLYGIIVMPAYKQQLSDLSSKWVFSIGTNVKSRNMAENAGSLLVQFDADSLRTAYAQYAGDVKGTILILNNNGEMIFDSTSQYVTPFSELQHIIQDDHIYYENQDFIVNLLRADHGFTIAGIMPKHEIYQSANAIKADIYKAGILCIILSVILNTVSIQIFSRKVKALVHAIRKLPQRDFLRAVIVKSSEDEIGEITEQFNMMQMRLIEYINKVYIAEIGYKNATLIALQSQINPHFLANTLESIRMKALTDGNEQIADMIYSLSTLFRYVLLKEGIVKLKDEIIYCEMYLKIFSYRYAHLLVVELDIEEGISNYAIGKLLLQPLIENSMVHGVDPAKESHRIQIKARRTDTGIRICIIDNGKGIKLEKLEMLKKQLMNSSNSNETDSRIGLSNTNERIRMLFGAEYSLDVHSEEGQGTRVTLDIPARSKEEMRAYV